MRKKKNTDPSIYVQQLEFVSDKATKTPFPLERRVAMSIHEAGMRQTGVSLLPGGGIVDGKLGDVIVLAPAYNIKKEELDLVVERLAKAIEHVLG
jgi:adenosylmethionine-8-amino-7-oxononanoate aminotransferase